MRGTGPRPALIVADEPTASLDVTTAAEIVGLLRLARQSGVAIALVSHDEALLSAVAGRIVRIRDGKTVPAEGREDTSGGGRKHDPLIPRRSVDSLAMNSPDAFEGAAPARGRSSGTRALPPTRERGLLTCRYSLDGREFAERVSLAPGPGWDTPAARAAARIVYLLAGVSYYKTAAPPVIDLGDTALTEREAAFLREFYLSGLGEYAYRNGLDLSALASHRGPRRLADPATSPPLTAPARRAARA